MTRINVTVDGVSYSDEVEPRTLLVQYLRESLGKTGTVIGCDTSNCGACTVHLDGTSVKSCNVLAVQADGHEVTTIEGLAVDGELHPVQQAFHECHALQCGYCTPGMIMQACDVLKNNPDPSEQEIREGLEGNLCRCTGYHNIVKAVQQAADLDELAGGVVMTITEDRAADAPTPEIGRSRTRKEDQRLITGRTRWTDNIQLPGMLHLAMVRSPFAHATISAINTDEAKAASGVVAVVHRGGPQGHPGRQHHGVAAQRRAEDARTTCPSVVPRRACRRDRRRRRGPQLAPRRVTPPSSSTSTTTSCPRSSTSRRPSRTRCWRTPTSAPTPRHWTLDSAAGGSGADVEDGIATAREGGIVIEREYRQQRLIPAFMEPRSTVVRPDRRAGDDVVGDPGAARPALLHRSDDRTARVQDPRHRPRRRRWLRRQAADHPRGVRDDRRGAQARQAVQVHRDPLRVDALRPPRPRPVAEADARRASKDGTVTGLKVELSPTSAPTSALVGGGVPVLGAWMFNSIYKFAAYQFTVHDATTRTRRGSTPTAVPVGPRRRSPSSA